MMNDKVIVEKVTESRSSTGAVTESWTTFVTFWAKIDQVSGDEGFNSDMIIANDIKKFTGYYEELKNVTPKMRIKYGDEYYYITSKDYKDRLKTSLVAIRNDDE